MIGRTNAGKGADNQIIVKNVSDIDKLLVKDNVGKVFKYVGETFYPQGQATPIVASQPFEKLFVDTRREPTVDEVYSWCDGGGSSGEPVLFGVISVSELESGSSANTYLEFSCAASNDQPVNASMILDLATFKGVYFMTSDSKFPDDPNTLEQLNAFGITKLGWQIDGVYTKVSFGLKADDPAYFVAINSYYDRWKDYFSTTPFPDPWVNNQLYEIVEDDNIKAKPIYILESLDADISADNVLLGYQGYNDKGELITGAAYNDLSAYFLLKPNDDSFFSRIRIDTNRIKADPKFAKIGDLRLGDYALSDLDAGYDIIVAKDVTSIASNCFKDSACIINWEDSDKNLSLSSEAFSNYRFPSGQLFYMPERITSIGADCFKDNYNASYSSAICISNLSKWLNIQFENEYSNPMYGGIFDLYLASEPLADIANNPDAYVSETSIPKLTILDLSNTNLTTINKWVMTGCRSLTEIKLPTSITSIGDGAFKSCRYVSTFDFSGLNLQSIGKEAFFMFGSEVGNRIFDFRNSSFTTVEEKTFGYDQGYTVSSFTFYSPSTLVEIKDNNFQYINGGDFYLSGQDVVKIGTGLWENSNNYKIYVPYTLIDRYRSDVSWLDFADNIYGYAPANTFEVGTTLPTESSVDSYTLKWYTENTLANQITTVTDPSAVLYCSISKYKKYYTLNIISANCSPYLTDGVTNYHLGDKIPSERELTLVINPISQNYVPYICYVNQENYLGSTKITVISDIELFISCTDGLDLPISTNISNMSWDNIRQVCLSNLASSFWKVGDVKTITSKSGNTYNIRLCDLQDGRYEYADGSGKSKAVFEFVDLYKLNGSYIDTKINNFMNYDGWQKCTLRSTVIPNIIDDLPDDLVSAISEVKVLCSIGGGNNQQVNSSNDKLFLPAEIELFSKKHYSIGLPESPLGQFDYYKANNTDEARIKSDRSYWERSPASKSNYYFCMIYSTGSYGELNADTTNGVALIFAI
jgi:hypothetical protein|nr:MAG TPA: leucine-rich repeat protein [Caudoviricetes sp.]